MYILLLLFFFQELDGLTKMSNNKNNMVPLDLQCTYMNTYSNIGRTGLTKEANNRYNKEKTKHNARKELVENNYELVLTPCIHGVLLDPRLQCFYYCIGLNYCPFGPMCCKEGYEATANLNNSEISCCNKRGECYNYINAQSHQCISDGLEWEGNQCFYLCGGNYSYGPFCCLDGYQLKTDTNFSIAQCCRNENRECYDFLDFPLDPNDPKCDDTIFRASVDRECYYICQGLNSYAIKNCCLDGYNFNPAQQTCCQNRNCYFPGS